MCGLKLKSLITLTERVPVTPFVGVWIETFWHCPKGSEKAVTPFVGVWIETYAVEPDNFAVPVTPFVGVWIETCINLILR